MSDEFVPGDFPETVEFWPLMGLSAIRCNKGGAWRLWLIAKTLDSMGRGSIFQHDLELYADFLGVSPKSYARWLKQAVMVGLLRPVIRKSGGMCFLLASHEKTADAVGCVHVDTRRVQIQGRLLIEKGWRAHIWEAYISTHHGRPISRKKMREITGVPESTQRTFERSVNIVYHHNYVVCELAAKHLTGVQEFIRPHAFKFWNPEKKTLVVAWRVPDCRQVDGTVECTSRGRSRKVNKRLNALRGLSNVGRASSAKSVCVKLFTDSSKETEAVLRKLSRADIPPWDVAEVFELFHAGKNSNFWSITTR